LLIVEAESQVTPTSESEQWIIFLGSRCRSLQYSTQRYESHSAGF